MDFEAKLEQFYNQLDLAGTLVIDIGAHVGRHAIPLAKKVGVEGVLYAFEPIPQIRMQLNENIISSGLNNVVVYPFALSSAQGVSDFNYIPNLPGESGIKKRHIYNSNPGEILIIQVGIFRLDNLVPLKNKISFIKIDVEGAELDVLRGAKDLLKSSRPIVAFECGAASFLGYHDSPEEIFNIFSSLDYQIYSITGERIIDSLSFYKTSHDQNYWDYLALPSGKEDLSRLLSNN
jgi:FkbM family methyltransferase